VAKKHANNLLFLSCCLQYVFALFSVSVVVGFGYFAIVGCKDL